MAPTCFGNSRLNPDVLCAAAVNSCPPGQIRFWVWHQTVEYTQTPGTTTSRVTVPWHQEARTYCLGADDPGVPTIATVVDQVQTDFSHLPLRNERVASDPGPTTVVNIDTAFSAGDATPQTFDPVLLGIPVHLTATPKRWHWTWGDGSSETTASPGVPKQPVVTHRYARVGDLTVTVTVEWAGTFTVGADPTVYTIAAPTRTAPQTTVLRVREARSELVSH
jgi:hypothetical protein